MTNKNKKTRKNAATEGEGGGGGVGARGGGGGKRVAFSIPESRQQNMTKSNQGVQPRIRLAGTNSTLGGLSKGQLAALIVLSLGISRLMLVGSAAQTTTTGAAESDNDVIAVPIPSPVCIQHLGEAACNNPSIQALLKYKYFTGIQSLLYVVTAVVQSWHVELLMQTLGAVFVLCLGAFGAALFSSPGLLDGTKANGIMCLVLTAVCLPQESIPWRRTSGYKSVQSLCLLTLAMQVAYEGALLFLHQYSYDYENSTVGANSDGGDATAAAAQTILLNHPVEDGEFWSANKPAVDAIVNFMIFDKFTETLVLLFAWYYLPNSRQRKFLLALAVVQLVEYFYGIPLVNQHVRVEQRESMALLSASWCALAWVAPDLRWKTRL